MPDSLIGLDDQHDACTIQAMTTTTDDSTWQYISEKLKSEIPSSRFDAWIRPLSAQCDGQKLSVFVPSKFFLDGLKSSYGETITALAREISGRDIVVSYQIDASLMPESDTAEQPAAAPTQSLVDGFIDPRFTFDNFVVGSGNEFCHAASRAVADKPGEVYNPLYLYGGVGLGKTHLINAVANALIARDHTRIAYRTGERFTNELIQAIRNGTSEQFRNQYRQVDVLIIDDIQFIAGKEKTQEEFFHTFNALYEVKKQIILTSDRSPRELTNLMERLRSRFNWGLVADIQPPDL
ncbi:MAG: chromosomal replication initiator protein DnaA, partial [Mariprofundus sp.]